MKSITWNLISLASPQNLKLPNEHMLYFWMILFIHVLGPHRVSGCCQCRARMMWYDPDEESCKTCFCTFGLALACGTWTCQEFGKCDKNFIARYDILMYDCLVVFEFCSFCALNSQTLNSSQQYNLKRSKNKDCPDMSQHVVCAIRTASGRLDVICTSNKLEGKY